MNFNKFYLICLIVGSILLFGGEILNRNPTNYTIKTITFISGILIIGLPTSYILAR